MTGVLGKSGNLDTDTHTRKGHVKMKTGIGVMLLQAKEFWQSSEAERSKK